MNPPRLIVTGSRTWRDAHRLYRELDRAAIHLGFLSNESTIDTRGVARRILLPEMRLIHGACPEGGDHLADLWARSYPPNILVVERYPYPGLLGRRGGPLRNQYMVGLGADLCLAALMPCTSPRCNRTDDHESHGASGCADFAELNHIETWRIRP